MKKQVNINNGTTTYEIESPTEVGQIISEQIFNTMAEHNVRTDEIMPILGEAVIKFLLKIANPLGFDVKELVKVFGEGLVNAEIEIKDGSTFNEV